MKIQDFDAYWLCSPQIYKARVHTEAPSVHEVQARVFFGIWKACKSPMFWSVD